MRQGRAAQRVELRIGGRATAPTLVQRWHAERLADAEALDLGRHGADLARSS